MDLFFAAVPIVVLIFLMTKKNGLPSTVAFALAALLTYLVECGADFIWSRRHTHLVRLWCTRIGGITTARDRSESSFDACCRCISDPGDRLRFVVDWKEIRRNLLFIELAILASVLPMVAVAAFNYEFPSVAGGIAGLLTTIFLARSGIGLPKNEVSAAGAVAPNSRSASQRPLETNALPHGEILRALTPLLAIVGILLLTRIPFSGCDSF